MTSKKVEKTREALGKVRSQTDRGKISEATDEYLKAFFPEKSESEEVPPSPTENDPVKNFDRVKPLPGKEILPGKDNLPGAAQESAYSSLESGRYFRLYNSITDYVFPQLEPIEVVVYLRLYRLSIGFNRLQCKVGLKSLMKAVKTTKPTLFKAIQSLKQKGLIKIISVDNTGTSSGGTTYQIYTEIGGAFKERSQPPPGKEILPGKKSLPGKETLPIKYTDDDDSKSSSNFSSDDDDDDNPHLQTVKHLYSKLTGNQWSPKDQAAYKAVAQIRPDLIEAAMLIVKDRAGSRINSFNFFVKEILAAANPSDASRAQIKKRLSQIVHRIQEAYVGSNPPLTIPDLEEKVMLACEREGVYFDKHLFNAILDRQA